jgi:gliotoxin/aspirochlorine biosynthesis gamma-glutamylcyclotransferase
VRDDVVWYFAYGSNMSPATFVERRQMRPLDACAGHIEGYRLCFDIPIGAGERGVANLQPDIGRTHGVAYLLTTDDADRLDRTEGVPQGFYFREAVRAMLVDGRSIDAYTYRSHFSSAARKPSARYMGILLDGAAVHGLPVEYVRWLEGWELAVDERLQNAQAATAQTPAAASPAFTKKPG